MPNKLRTIVPLCLALVLPAAALAESGGEMSTRQEAPPSVGAMPSRGMTMDQVKQYFGEPRKRIPPVGDPPITRWQYDDMMVYFEYKYVIDSVATNDKPQ